MPYLCDRLGIEPEALCRLDRAFVLELLAYQDGKALGEWACMKREERRRSRGR